jgi:hypothetical protein
MPHETFLPAQESFDSKVVENALASTETGRRIRDAWLREKSVPKEVRDQFLQALAQRIRDGEEVVHAIDASIEDGHRMLRKVRVKAPSLSNVCTAYHLLRAAERDGRLPPEMSTADEAVFHELLRKSATAVRSLLPGVIRKGRPVVWWTDSSQLDGRSASEIRNDLALEGDAYSPCHYLVEARLPADAAGDCAVPTVLDAGNHPAFWPSDPAAPAGVTRLLDGRRPGLSEWVGHPAPADKAEWIARGHVSARLEAL